MAYHERDTEVPTRLVRNDDVDGDSDGERSSYKDEGRRRLLASEETAEMQSFRPSIWRRFGRAFRRQGAVRIESPGESKTSLHIRKQKSFGRACVGIVIGFLAILGIVHLVYSLLGLAPLFWNSSDDSYPEEWRRGQSTNDWMAYPTDFTRDITPIPCHSHNDYWRRVPVFEAIHFGCTGIEADVWLFDDDLFVGHNIPALTKNRTFRNLYVDPLVDLLDRQNQESIFPGDRAMRGIFDQEPDRTMVLLVDFKNGAESIWPVVETQLEPLRAKGYLSYFNGTAVLPRPITVVATGNAPYHLAIANATYRDMFYDAPIASLDNSKLQDQEPFSSHNSYYASTDFVATIGYPWLGKFTDGQRAKMVKQIEAAHVKGLKARYWNTPGWPVSWRNHVWSTLVELGVDYLNADDLRAVSQHDWRKNKNRDW